MTSEQAARVVFVAGMIEAGYVLLRGSKSTLADGKTYKSLWSIGLLTLGLAVMADFVPQIAGPFALLVLVAMIVRNRGEVGKVISSNAPSSPSSPKKKTATGAGGGSAARVQ